MNYFKKWTKLQFVQIVLGLLLTLTPFLLSPVCTKRMANGQPMPCHYSAWLVTVLGILLTLLALQRPRLEQRAMRIGKPLLTIALLVLILFVPTGIIPLNLPGLPHFGLCKHAGMPCLQTFTYVKWLAGLSLLLAFVDLALQLLAKPER